MSNQSVSSSSKYRSALAKARAKFPDFDVLPTNDLLSFSNASVSVKGQSNALPQLPQH